MASAHSPPTRGALSEGGPSGPSSPRKQRPARPPELLPSPSARRELTAHAPTHETDQPRPPARASCGHRPRPRHRRPPPRPPSGEARPTPPPPPPPPRGPAARSPSRWPRPCSRSPWLSWSAPESEASTGVRQPPWIQRAARCASRISRSAGEVGLFFL